MILLNQSVKQLYGLTNQAGLVDPDQECKEFRQISWLAGLTNPVILRSPGMVLGGAIFIQIVIQWLAEFPPCTIDV